MSPFESLSAAQLQFLMFQRKPGGLQFAIKLRPGVEDASGLDVVQEAFEALPSATSSGQLTAGDLVLRFKKKDDALQFDALLSENAVAQFAEPVGIGPNVTLGPGEALVFICHASEDKEHALTISNILRQSGIETFIDTDDIRPDASFVARINQALVQCTHFLAILSPISSKKPWPRHEVESITPRVVAKEVAFLPFALDGYTTRNFRHDFATLALIPLRPLDDDREIGSQLVSDILGLANKPALGLLPAAATKAVDSGLSPAANVLAEWLARNSRRAHDSDPSCDYEELRQVLQLTEDDLQDAVDELHPYVDVYETSASKEVTTTEAFFAEYDQIFMAWNPEADARLIAAELTARRLQIINSEVLAAELGFEPRRMNPAIAWLLQEGHLERHDYAVGDHDFIQYRLFPTPSLRRFAKQGPNTNPATNN